MTTKVKICGIRTAEALEAALDGGADYVGLVFFSKSPRNVSLTEGAALADTARGKTKTVALVVDESDALLAAIAAEVRPDLVQMHGSETPERVAEIKARHGMPIMKAIKVETADDAREALAFKGVADLILFDAKAPKGMAGALPGGNAITFDWRALEGVKSDIGHWMLAGGLTPENVAEAVRLTQAPAVDVSSGVETAPGLKSPELIRRFLRAAKTAKS
jgi:phosphoribosylanthranilate isomerase